MDRFQTINPKTVSDVTALFDAYSSLGAAEGFYQLAENDLSDLLKNQAQYNADDQLAQLMLAAENYTIANEFVALGRDAIDIETGFGSVAPPSPEKVSRIADALRRVAEANLALFDTLEIQKDAQQYGVSADIIKSRLLTNDGDFQMMWAAQTGMGNLTQQMGSSPNAPELVFGNAQNMYAFSSILIAKYYSLEAQWDKNLTVVSIKNDKALAAMLDYADQRARELINLDGDDISIPAIIYYENAHALRQGTPTEQLNALNYYWQASALAEADAFLTGKIAPK